jgi:hypothetical protein
MESRFPPSEGFEHEAVSPTEYRVRRGFLRGLDVRVWRQEDLIVSVSSGSRLGSLLPGLAAVVAAVAVGGLIVLGPERGIHVSFEDGVTWRMSYLVSMVGFVVFLILWVLLSVLLRPLVRPLRADCNEQTILAEITRGLSG